MSINLNRGIVSMTDFARNRREHAEELIASGEPRVLTHNGRAKVVVLSVDAYETLARESEEYRMDLQLRSALENYAAGDRGESSENVFASIRKQTAKRRKKAK